MLLGALCLTCMTMFRKQYEKYNGADLCGTLVFVAVYALIVSVCAFVYENVPFAWDGVTLLLATLCAITVTVTTVICIVGVEYGSVSMLIVFATLGTVCISSIYDLTVNANGGNVSVFNVIGFVLVAVILAFGFVSPRNETAKSKNPLLYKVLCVVVFFSNGMALLYYSLFTKYRADVGNGNFLGLYCAIMAVLSAVIFAVTVIVKRRSQPVEIKSLVLPKSWWCVGCYAVLFCVSELLALVCTTQLPLFIQAPLSFSLPILFVVLADRIIYKEKITKLNVIKIVLAVVASVMFVL